MKFKMYSYDPAIGTFCCLVSDKPMESKEEEGLWNLNKAREHDNLAPRKRLPIDTTFTEIEA